MRTRNAIGLTLLALGAAWFGLGYAQNAKRETAFDQTKIGDAEAIVIERFGAPDVREDSSDLFATYASEPCKAPCVSRLWWEDSLLPSGIAAWSVELSADRRVLSTARWVSP
jgi:hypothetical protein